MSFIDDDAGDTSCLPDQPIRRAPVVYGKRSNHQLPQSPRIPADGHELTRVHHPRAAPPQQRWSSPSPSIHASDSEHSFNPDAAFQFGFRHQLKELDKQFDNRDTQSGPSSSGQAERVKLSEGNGLQSVSMGTVMLSCEARCPSGDLPRASLSPSSASLRTIAAQEGSPETPVVRRRTRRVANPIHSDSEVEGPSNSSSVSPVRHAITTPHSRSSPTPPTSGEIPMMSRKAKGKAPSRDVLPLLFDGERPSAAKLPNKGRRSEPLGRSKTKAPSKKERREATFESSRIAANRPVEVVRSQEQKHSLSAFFAGLRRDNIVTTTSSTELSSDPIERFSSPADTSTRVPPRNIVFGAPTGLLRTSTHVGTSDQPFSSKDIKTLPPAADDSDDEMPLVTSVIQEASGKQQKLQKIKQAVLQHADTSEAFGIDSEDDLLVVKDDMHAVAREEAAQRRLNRAHGSPAKDRTSLGRISHTRIRLAAASPQKLSRQELQELAKPSFARMGKGVKGQLSKKQLDQLMIMQHTEEQLESIKRHEQEWVRRGGKLSRDTGDDNTRTSLPQKLGAYVEQGLKAATDGGVVRDEASTDESDEDYTPDLRGSASPEPMCTNEEDGEPGDNMEVSEVPQPPVGDGDDEDEVVAPLRPTKSGQRHRRVIVGSDDEGEQTVHRNVPTVQRDSTSSMESQTEDENDKENSAKLMYDRSEDKENKAVVRHELSSSELAFVSRPGSQHGIESGAQRSLSLASATNSPEGNARSPLKDISKDEDDLFLSLPPSKSPFTDHLLRSVPISPPRPSVSTLSLASPPVLQSERSSRKNRLSLDSEISENDENGPSGFKPLQPSFLERLHSEASLEPSLVPINPLSNGGFSQLFSASDQSSKGLIVGGENDGLSLTLDVGLKPALEVSGTLRQKAETIFEKEQEYLVAAAVQQNDKPKELLYVNDHGFLTQTRPEGSSPQAYRMTPSQASKFIGTQVHTTQTHPLSARPPLRTLSFTVSQELSPEPQPLRRLHKRSPSPLEQKNLGQNSNPVAKLNAFSILGKAPNPPSKGQTDKHQKSDFVAVEAEESDEDDMFGFGGPKKGDDDDDDDDEHDKIVEGLVDDTVMDAEIEAVDLVQEKYREHEEEDDQRLQKLHQDAVDGKLRTKRRDRGVGFEDDSDEDDDEDARRIRQRMSKKRKIEGDSLEALGQNEETRAFYVTYHQDLIDEDDEFRHLREDVAMSADDDGAQVEPGEGEIVSVDEIRQRVRDMAQNNHDVKVLDPEDTSWIDQSMMIEVDDAVRVKVVEHRRNKSTARQPNVGRMDFDEERPERAENEHQRNQLMSWAKDQCNRHQGTGRSGNSAAVTGHTKAKTGGGSLRSIQLSNTANINETYKPKTSSLLSTVSHRKGKFA